MDEGIIIDNQKFKIIDVKNKITLADSFVRNKIGIGHGEGKLYIGNESDFLSSFFDDYDRKCFILKSDLLDFMEILKDEYIRPKQDYQDKKLLKRNYDQCKKMLSNISNDIMYFNIFKSQVKPPRVYINSKDENYKLLRLIGIPNYSYLSILKLEKDNEIYYYFKIFQENKDLSINQDIDVMNLEDITLPKKMNIIQSRKGQGKYREKVLEECMACPFTSVNDERLLIASHIKPWSKCNENEKIDPKNGIALTPTFDKLFDSGFITFNFDKTLVVSPWLSPANKKRLKISSGMKIKKLPLDEKREKYMQYHREHIFKK